MANRKTNLVKSTLAVLDANRERWNVLWVGARDGSETCSWEEFVEAFSDVEFYAGYGLNEIRRDLVVVGADFWLERWEYDGSEGWEFKEMPTRPLEGGSTLTSVKSGW